MTINACLSDCTMDLNNISLFYDVPKALRRIIVNMLMVRDCVRLQIALRDEIYDRDELVRRKQREPLKNTLRLFKSGQLRTYTIYSYIKDDVTYTDVSVAPLCHTFTCVHTHKISPSVASHWILTCVYDGGSIGKGNIKSVTKRGE